MKRFSKLTAVVFSAVLALGFFGCKNDVPSGGGDTPAMRPEVSGKLGKYASPYEVGDIVFNDGSATPYKDGLSLTSEQQEAAIAIIFYKGTELNSDDAEGNADTTTSRTLGVGLKHKSALAWCTTSAKACNKGITTIQCPASGSTGAWTFTGDKKGSDNLEQISDFLKAADGVDDDTGTEANYPAFYFAKKYSDTTTNLDTNYADGWYLPSSAELFQIYKNGKGTSKVFDIDEAIGLCNGDKFLTDWYFSSTQVASIDSDAYILNFNKGSWSNNGSKSDNPTVFVCAVREF